MAYAFTNLMNLADKKQDESTAPISKSAATMPSGGVSGGGAGQLQQAPVANKGAAVGQQFEAAKPVIQNQVAASQGNLRTLGTQGAAQIKTQEDAYRKSAAFDPRKYGIMGNSLQNAVRDGKSTGTLEGAKKILGGSGFETAAFDAAPEAANRFSGILAGGGGQYLTQNLGGGTGALERVAGNVYGGEVGQTAEEEGTKLGGIATAREKTATGEMTNANSARLKSTQEQIRKTLADERARLLGDNPEQDAAEQAAYDQAGEAEKKALLEKTLADNEVNLRRHFGEVGKGRDKYEQTIRNAIQMAMTRAGTGPRSGKDVITQNEADQLGRIGGLTGEAVPGVSEAANYGGQYSLDPNFIPTWINKLNEGQPTQGGALPGDPMQGALSVPPGEGSAPEAPNPYLSVLTGGFAGGVDTSSPLFGGLDALWK
jgi:hypothetical protein